MRKNTKPTKLRILLALILQIIAMSIFGGLTAFSFLLGKIGYGLIAFALLPLLGAVSAYFVTVNGLNNYLAWIAPPLCMTVTHIALWSYLPDFGPVLTCAFVSLVGAAAGEVRKRERQGKKRA